MHRWVSDEYGNYTYVTLPWVVFKRDERGRDAFHKPYKYKGWPPPNNLFRPTLLRTASLVSEVDAELALVTTIGRRDPVHAQALHTDIATLRTDLVEQAKPIGDPRLTEKLAARAAAAVDYDPDAHTLPDPDEADLVTATDALAERIDLITGELSNTGTTIPAEVILLSITDQYPILDTLLPSTDPTPSDPPGGSDTAEPVRLPDPEVELLDRLFARDPDTQSTATTLLARVYWQRETLSQAVTEETRRIPRQQPTKSFGKVATTGNAIDIPAFIISRMHLEALTTALAIAHMSVTGYQAHRAQRWMSEPEGPSSNTIRDRFLLPVASFADEDLDASTQLFD